MITMNKTQGSPQNAIIFGHSFLHKGSVEELVRNLIFILFFFQTSFLYNSLCIIEGF